MKKIYLALLLGIFLLSFASAALDITQTISDKSPANYNYGKIELKDWFGLGEIIWTGEIASHTEYCSSDCSSIIKLNVKEGLPIYDSIKFYKIDGDKRIEKNIYSYKIEIKTGQEIVNIPNYITVCTNLKPELNGTIPKSCEAIKSGTRQEYRDTWKEIAPDTKSDGKDIEIKISGNKKATDIIDWVIITNGESLDSWAAWGGTGTNYFNAYPALDTDTGADASQFGFNFTVNYTSSGISIALFPSQVPQATRCILQDATFNSLNISSVSGGVCTIYYNLVAGTEYNMKFDGDAAVVDAWRLTVTFPLYRAGMTIWEGKKQNATSSFLWEISNATVLGTPGGSITLNAPADGFQTISNNINFNCSATPGTPATLANISLWTNTTGTWKINQTQIRTGATNSSSFMVNNIPLGNYNWTCSACDSDGDCGQNAGNRTFGVVPVVINKLIYNNITYSGLSETLAINLTYVTAPNVFLYYNNTQYGTTTTDGQIYSTTINIPLVSNQNNKTFWFSIVQGATTTNSSKYNQTINPFSVDNCSLYARRILKFDMADEETLNYINGTIEYLINFYNTARTINLGVFNNSVTYIYGNTYEVCLQNITGNYSMDYQVRYNNGSGTYFTRYRNIQNRILSPTSLEENMTLYNLLIASGNTFSLHIRGSPIGNAGLLVDVEKKYVALNQYLSVESPVTDSQGNTIARLIPSNEIYNFVISYNGAILGTFNQYQVKCDNPATGDCPIYLNLAEQPGNTIDFANYGNISGVYLLNNNTNVLSYTFKTTDSNAHTITQVVKLNDGFGNTTLCNNSAFTTGQTFLCTIPAQYEQQLFYSDVYSDGNYVGTSHFILGNKPDYQGVEVYIAILLYSTLVLLMLSNPILTIVGAAIGMISTVILLYIGGISFTSIIGIVVYFLIAAIIIINKMRRTY